jgi:hypothetical protein
MGFTVGPSAKPQKGPHFLHHPGAKTKNLYTKLLDNILKAKGYIKKGPKKMKCIKGVETKHELAAAFSTLTSPCKSAQWMGDRTGAMGETTTTRGRL